MIAVADPSESAWRRNEARVACSSADCTSGSGRRNRRSDSVKLVGENTALSSSSSEDDGDLDLAAFALLERIEKDVEALSTNDEDVGQCRERTGMKQGGETNGGEKSRSPKNLEF